MEAFLAILALLLFFAMIVLIVVLLSKFCRFTLAQFQLGILSMGAVLLVCYQVIAPDWETVPIDERTLAQGAFGFLAFGISFITTGIGMLFGLINTHSFHCERRYLFWALYCFGLLFPYAVGALLFGQISGGKYFLYMAYGWILSEFVLFFRGVRTMKRNLLSNANKMQAEK